MWRLVTKLELRINFVPNHEVCFKFVKFFSLNFRAISLKLNYIAPLDKNLVFHRLIAYVIVFATCIHGFGHYMNYSCCADFYNPQTG